MGMWMPLDWLQAISKHVSIQYIYIERYATPSTVLARMYTMYMLLFARTPIATQPRVCKILRNWTVSCRCRSIRVHVDLSASASRNVSFCAVCVWFASNQRYYGQRKENQYGRIRARERTKVTKPLENDWKNCHTTVMHEYWDYIYIYIHSMWIATLYIHSQSYYILHSIQHRTLYYKENKK